MILIISLLSGTPGVKAQTCQVPGHTDTIGAAIADLSCYVIELGATTYEESVEISRDLVLTGVGSDVTTIAGRLEVSGPTIVEISSLTVDTTTPATIGCFRETVKVSGGAMVVVTSDTYVRNAHGGCRIFKDGFE